METGQPRRDLLEDTICDLEDTIDRLSRERADLDSRLTDVKSRCDEWREILAQVSRNGTTTTPRRRARKGENLCRINELFNKVGPSAKFSMADIARKTGIPWSSVRNELNRATSRFGEDTDGFWSRINADSGETVRVSQTHS